MPELTDKKQEIKYGNLQQKHNYGKLLLSVSDPVHQRIRLKSLYKITLSNFRVI